MLTISHEVLVIGCLAALSVLGIGWSLIREWQLAKVDRVTREADNEMIATLKAMHSLTESLCRRTEEKLEQNREHHNEMMRACDRLSSLMLDVEKRLAEGQRNNREWCRQQQMGRPEPAQIYSTINNQPAKSQFVQGDGAGGDQKP